MLMRCVMRNEAFTYTNIYVLKCFHMISHSTPHRSPLTKNHCSQLKVNPCKIKKFAKIFSNYGNSKEVVKLDQGSHCNLELTQEKFSMSLGWSPVIISDQIEKQEGLICIKYTKRQTAYFELAICTYQNGHRRENNMKSA